MLIVGVISWWYTTGWVRCFREAGGKLLGIYDYFSIDLLLRTLFSPFRQISAGKINGPIGVQLRNLVDKLLSRVIGAVMRTLVIVIGSVTLLISSILQMLKLVVWPLVPLLPIVAIWFAAVGWVPWKI
ncbi:MAG: hypothetical protein ABI397_03370 [Candidatus Saccharimonas sp.]